MLQAPPPGAGRLVFRRHFYRAALASNAVLLAFGASSIQLGASTPTLPATSPNPAPAAVAIQQAPVAATGPLQVALPQAPPPPHQVPAQPLQAPVPGPSPEEKLKADILAAISASSAQTAGVVVEVENLGRILESNPKELLPPASAQKLRTAGVALLRLGPNFQYRTEVLGSGGVTPEGILHGNLVLAGGGDPALSRFDLAALAASLHAAGLRTVDGGLWGDESRYDALRYGPGWKPDYVTHESGALSALAVDENQYRKDPSFINDPALANAELFRSALAAAGVSVNGPTTTGRPPGDLRVLAAHTSPPLAALVGPMLRESDNFFAEMVLKELGRTIGKPSTQGGAEVVQSTARSLGVSAGEVHDGSGLSPYNRQSAGDELSWLKAMDGQKIGQTLRSSLAVSCAAPGTLKKRFCGTSGAGHVFGKTGALPGSAVLVGYTQTASERAVRVSFVFRGTGSTKQARDAIDRAVLALRDFRG